MTYVPAPSNSRFSLFIPWWDDGANSEDPGQERNRRAENMRYIQNWANFKQPTEMFADVTIQGDTIPIAFPIPAGYTNLRIKVMAQTTSGASVACSIVFNNDNVVTNYFTSVLPWAYGAAGSPTIYNTNATNGILLGNMNSATNKWSMFDAQVSMYADGTRGKNVILQSVFTDGAVQGFFGQGFYAPIAPITTVTISSVANFVNGSRIQIIGEY